MANKGTILKDVVEKTSIDNAANHLPIMTKSLCPECLTVIDAKIDDEDNMVFMDKCCPEHGPCRELISTDAKFYNLIISRDLSRRRYVCNPINGREAVCPNRCGICSQHLSLPTMMNIDLTNPAGRCF